MLAALWIAGLACGFFAACAIYQGLRSGRDEGEEAMSEMVATAFCASLAVGCAIAWAVLAGVHWLL